MDAKVWSRRKKLGERAAMVETVPRATCRFRRIQKPRGWAFHPPSAIATAAQQTESTYHLYTSRSNRLISAAFVVYRPSAKAVTGESVRPPCGWLILAQESSITISELWSEGKTMIPSLHQLAIGILSSIAHYLR